MREKSSRNPPRMRIGKSPIDPSTYSAIWDHETKRNRRQKLREIAENCSENPNGDEPKQWRRELMNLSQSKIILHV